MFESGINKRSDYVLKLIIDFIQVIYIFLDLGKIMSVELLKKIINNLVNLLSLVKISYVVFCVVYIIFCIELGFFGWVMSFKIKKIKYFFLKKYFL